MKLLGFDIGGTKCAAVTALWDGERLTLGPRVECPTDHTLTGAAMAERLFSLAEKMPGTPDAIGISCGGPLDAVRGVVESPPNLPTWQGVPIAAMARERFGAPARLVNDANAGAVAEWRFGAGRGLSHLVFLTFGTGLGAGLVLNGRLYEGASGNAGEVGHVRLAEDGPLGFGKRGSFEGFCSGGGIARLAEQMAKEATEPPAYMRGPITAKSVAEAARAGDAVAREVFRISGERLGEGLAMLVDILDPEAIIAGSMLVRCYDLLWEHAERTLRREALGGALSRCRILPAALGERVGDYAALGAALMNEV